MPQVTFRLPSWLLDATDEEAHQRSTRSDNWSRSRIFREALKQYLKTNDIAPETVEELEGHIEVSAPSSLDGPEIEVKEVEA